jgi:hypothetical protein
MAKVKILTEPCRSCEESLTFRATVSPPHLRRKLPKLALPPLPGLTPRQELSQLLEQLDSPRASSYRRIAEQALADNNADEIARSIRSVQFEIDRCLKEAKKMHRLLPRIYPKPAA